MEIFVSVSVIGLAPFGERVFAMNEKDLREWLRSVMGTDVNWIEPAFGSTVGRPDADFNINGKLIPVELKWWDRTRKGLKKKMRPAQIRYHIMSSKRNMQTAIISGVEWDKSYTQIFVVAGKNCPRSPYEETKMSSLGTKKFRDDNYEQSKNEIRSILASEEFWK